MSRIAYTCKYSPVELMAAFGAEPLLMNSEVPDFDHAQTVTHMNMCGHCKAVIEAVHRDDIRELVLTTCCDSMRRTFDVLKKDLDFSFVIDLPHNVNSCSVDHLADELIRFCSEYSAYSGRSFDYDKFAEAFESPQTAENQEYIAVLGARVGEGLLEKLKELAGFPLRSFTCNDNRFLQAPPEQLPEDAASGEDAGLRALMEWYARELLSQMPCMRMADIASRRRLTADPYIKGIIYHTVQFCDYYSFEYERLRRETGLPMIKIETDFTMQSLGQLATRVEGFCESIGLGKEKIMPGNGRYYMGIDSGSTTTNVCVIDENAAIVKSATVRTGARAQNGAEKAFQAVGIPRDDIAVVIATGYGRDNIQLADGSVTEITCHARGAHALCPEARTIIDLGGQDSKAISLDENGKVKNFAMNDKCAAGTGRFLENMSKVLEIDLNDMGDIGLAWKEDISISSMCTVFAESEVVSLIADNKEVPDIVHGLSKSVASKVMALTHRVHGEGPYMMTGGGARNKAVVKCIEASLGQPVFVPDEPDLCGAYGAALFARDHR